MRAAYPADNYGACAKTLKSCRGGAPPPPVLLRDCRAFRKRAGTEPGPYKKTGRIGHHPKRYQPGAKRGKRRTSLRLRTKTTPLADANAGERPRKVRCQAHPAEDRQVLWALVQTSPRILGEFDTCGQIPPQRLFLFWTVHGPFSLFGATEKRKWGVHCPAIIMAEIHPARQGK